MNFKIFLNENIDEALKRISIELVTDSLDHLNNVKVNFDDSIHETRKNFKKLRAVMRLVRIELGQDLFRKQNILYRDTSRLLSGIRDAAVMVESVDYIRKSYSEEIDKISLSQLRKHLSLRARRVRAQFKKNTDLIDAVKTILNKHIDEIRDLPLHKKSFELIAPGIRLVYERGFNAMETAKLNPSAENYHEWRKRAKYLWYHVRILENAWPEVMIPLANKLSDISDILGREHDLAELRELINKESDLYKDEVGKNKFLNFVGQERLQLQSEAKAIAPYIYCETSDQFIGRLGNYWEQSVKTTV